MSKSPILPDPLPALDDPRYEGPGPYSISGLRDVCGTVTAPDCPYYQRRELMKAQGCWLKTCANSELEVWINQVGGFDPHSKIIQPPLAESPMSGVIPRMIARGEKLPYPLSPGTYIVDYPSLNSNASKLPERSWVPDLKERFPDDSKLLLSFFGSRSLTVGLWVLTGFWRAEFLSQFDGVLLPDFSNFADDSWPQSLIGERMMQVFGEEGSAAGTTIIPTIAWASEASLRRQVELWVSQYPYINTIHLDCYGADVDRVKWIWRWLYAIEKYCQPHQHIRWLVSGITTGWGIRELNEMFPNNNYNVIMPLSPYVNAMVGSTDREYQGQAFRKKIQTIEDFYFGRVVSEKMERPDSWPQFKDCLK